MACDECPNSGLAQRVTAVEHDTIRFASALEGIKANTDELVTFARQQVRLEERQISQGQAIERAFDAIQDIGNKLDIRVKLLEANAPTNNLATKWVFGAVVFILAGVGSFIGGKL